MISKNPSQGSYAQKPDRIFSNAYDPITREIEKKQKQTPVLINYSIGTRRYEKKMDVQDLALTEKIESSEIPYWFPADRMMEGGETRRNDPVGITHIHQFYTRRILTSLSFLSKMALKNPQLGFLMGSVLPKLTILNRYMPQHGGRALVGPMANTLYVPPVSIENNIIDQLEFQFKKIIQALTPLSGSAITTQAAQSISINDSSMDYIFLDPPFGANIMYSELNFIRESWLNIFTNNKLEAIENKTQHKGFDEYRTLMTNCFKETYRILKPGHWVTVEFSNTKASVWNSIQTSLSVAGFIIATVTTLDKTRGGLHSMLGPTSVKQDLIISAYKPNDGFEERFIKEADTPEGVWDFVRTHLKYLPVIKVSDDDIQPIPERDPRIIFDQVVAYYVRKNIAIPISSSQEFQAGLPQRFVERDGMFFLAEQVSEYDRKKLAMGNRIKGAELFVLDEATAIQWLRQTLEEKPQTFQQINPHFMQEISGWSKNEKSLELFILLEQNFLKDKKDCWHVPDPENAAHIEQMREKALLKEFETYKTAVKKLKTFRIEAVRAGFKKSYIDHDYETIIKVADKLQGDVIEEDPKLLMYYSNAQTRLGKD
ncbi:hypothetical protein FACS1894137_04330 [Spirochaetia bacterium]|nr:hypothetical protein FACS1894137_04330 [Spirochaetia bacterium]